MSVEVKANSSSSDSASDDDYESYESIGDTDSENDDDELFKDTTTGLDDSASALLTSTENVDMHGESTEIKEEPSDEVFLAQAKKLIANRQENLDDTKDEKDESGVITRKSKRKLLSYEQPADMPSRKDRGQHLAYQKYREQLGRTRPDMVVDRERERALNRIATRGVVQLFNAVAGRQELIKSDLSTVKSEFKKERIRESHRQEGDEFEDKLKKGGNEDVKKTTAKWMSGNIADVLLDKGDEKEQQPKKKRRAVTDD